MKKIIAFLLLNFFILTNSCYAFSELYCFKNTEVEKIEPIVKSNIELNSFKIMCNNPYYAVSEQNNDYAIVILQKNGENVFYYYKSGSNSKVNRSVLKEVKRQNIIIEQSFNKSIISIYDDIADTLINNGGNPVEYVFRDENVNSEMKEQEFKQQNQGTFSGYIAQIASGTKFNVYLQDAINTATAAQGDVVIAVLQDGIVYNGNIIIPQGSLVYGKLTKARSATYGSLSGKIVINFNQIVTPENQTYYISTENVEFAVANEGKAQESVKNAASTAAVGAIVGLLFGLLANNGHAGRSAAIGAGIGAGSSVIHSVAEKGVDAEIPSFTEIELTLTWPLNVNVSK